MFSVLVFTTNYIINFSLSFFHIYLQYSSRSFTPTLELFILITKFIFYSSSMLLLCGGRLFAGRKANKRYDIMQIVKTLFGISVWEVISHTLQSNVCLMMKSFIMRVIKWGKFVENLLSGVKWDWRLVRKSWYGQNRQFEK